MSKARVTSKGQMTIPVEVRRALGLRTRDAVTLELGPDGALLRKASTPASLRGSLKPVKVPWESARRKAWLARAQRIARSSPTPTPSSGS